MKAFMASREAMQFAPAYLRVREQPPSPLPRAMLYLLLGVVAGTLAWAALGRIDVVAVAPGKLVPQSFVKVVQPAEGGIIREILVGEGDRVAAGQTLMRMDKKLADADRSALDNDIKLKALQLRRIDAELRNGALARRQDDAADLFAQVEAQLRSRRQAHRDSLEGEQAQLVKAQQELSVALEVENKLKKTLPIYREQAQAWDQLAREGFAGKLLALDRRRVLVESEQDLRAQAYTIGSLRAAIAQSEKRSAQISSNYRQQLQAERVETAAQLHRMRQEWDKQQHRYALLELAAPQTGIVKDLATHTPGTVVAPGTILLTLVPEDEPLHAEVWVSNVDVGFVRAGQPVKLKLAGYPFHRYGMVDGVVRQVSADATDAKDTQSAPPDARNNPLHYRASVTLSSDHLLHGDEKHAFAPGMQVNAEIHLGTRTILEYLLSPVQKTLHEAGRER
ncbi:MAG: HlyD family type I secretion periplasmic adaptor subunit [Betaproteobacteria bacterium]|nr:HlyD family type I secretion periplasmic adaptor subunit [Betaproteobacteria bacterium]